MCTSWSKSRLHCDVITKRFTFKSNFKCFTKCGWNTTKSRPNYMVWFSGSGLGGAAWWGFPQQTQRRGKNPASSTSSAETPWWLPASGAGELRPVTSMKTSLLKSLTFMDCCSCLLEHIHKCREASGSSRSAGSVWRMWGRGDLPGGSRPGAQDAGTFFKVVQAPGTSQVPTI